MERFEVGAWAELVRELRPGYLRLPPAAIRMVLQADLPRDTFASVRAVGSGTAPLPPELSEAFYPRYGVPVLVKYGATEFAGAIAGWSLRDHGEYWEDKRATRLTRYQMPVLIRVVGELPRTPSMKVNRPRLREIVLDSDDPSGAATEVTSHG